MTANAQMNSACLAPVYILYSKMFIFIDMLMFSINNLEDYNIPGLNNYTAIVVIWVARFSLLSNFY